MRILLLNDFALEGEMAQVFALGRALTVFKKGMT